MDLRAIDLPDAATFRREYLRQRRPALLCGLAREWRASREWSLPSLQNRFGDRRVPIIRITDGLLSYKPGSGMQYEETTLGEFLRSLETDDNPPTHFLKVQPQVHFPELLDEIEIAQYCRKARWRDFNLSIGGEGTTTPIHREFADNLFAVVHGEKEILLFAPSEARNLYAFGPLSGIPHLCRVDPRLADTVQFPRVERSNPYRCLLRSGDVLFIPRGWWHAVRTNETTIAFSAWWAEGTRSLVLYAAAFYKRLLGIRT